MSVELYQVLNFIKYCSWTEGVVILKKLQDNNKKAKKLIVPETVLDELKLDVLKEAFNKYSLEELTAKLK